jgi:hypothetical protein
MVLFPASLGQRHGIATGFCMNFTKPFNRTERTVRIIFRFSSLSLHVIYLKVLPCKIRGSSDVIWAAMQNSSQWGLQLLEDEKWGISVIFSPSLIAHELF